MCKGLFIIKTTCSYKRDRTQNKWFLSQQSKEKRNKIKIVISTVMFLFPNHTLKLNTPDEAQSEGEESLLTGDVTYSLCNTSR